LTDVIVTRVGASEENEPVTNDAVAIASLVSDLRRQIDPLNRLGHSHEALGSNDQAEQAFRAARQSSGRSGG